MTGSDELTTYVSGVPGIGANCGGPSKFGVNVGPFLSGTVAVCGIELAITASCACGVPATDGSTAPASEAGGICAKSGGQRVAGDEGPRARQATSSVNQRPASST